MKYLIKALSVGATRYAGQPTRSWAYGNYEPATLGMRAWLLDGTGYSQVSTNAAGHIVIECAGSSWAEANGSDLVANREASFESLHPRQHNIYKNKAVAWPLITSYYSAYFSAQSFLRCLGLGTIYIESSEATSLNAAWIAKGFTAAISASSYYFSIDLTPPTRIVFRKLNGAGGAHHQFWAGFNQSQSDVHQQLLVAQALATLSPTDRQTADSDYTKLLMLFFSSPAVSPQAQNFYWLSKFRNSINYRFSDHVWMMNWHHSAGLTTTYQTLIDRYSEGNRTLPDVQRNFSKSHLGFVAAKLFQVVKDSSSHLSPP